MPESLEDVLRHTGQTTRQWSCCQVIQLLTRCPHKQPTWLMLVCRCSAPCCEVLVWRCSEPCRGGMPMPPGPDAEVEACRAAQEGRVGAVHAADVYPTTSSSTNTQTLNKQLSNAPSSHNDQPRTRPHLRLRRGGLLVGRGPRQPLARRPRLLRHSLLLLVLLCSCCGGVGASGEGEDEREGER